VGRGFNQPIGSGDPTAHAEIIAIRAAARALGNYRLTDATLCVTIEPCLMCVGALVHARIGTLVYGAAEPRTGAIVSTTRGADLPGHNHRVAVVSGVREEECRALMQEFFRGKR
jgi:tRNA(adenine34) deaminase